MNRSRKNPLLFYFLLAFGVTWTVASPLVIMHWTWQQAPLLGAAAAFGPSIAAVIVTRFFSDGGSIRDLLRPYFRWRARPLAYALTLLPGLVSVAVALAYAGLGGARPNPVPYFSLPALLAATPIMLIIGPISEEAGWRGFALPRLQRRFGALKATLFLGALWWLWHLPVWFVGGGQGSPLTFGLFLFHILGLSLILSLIYDLSNGSLMLTVLGHFCANFGTTIGSWLIPKDRFYLCGALAWFVCGLFVSIWLKRCPPCATQSDQKQGALEPSLRPAK